jgi:hypothetical protein
MFDVVNDVQNLHDLLTDRLRRYERQMFYFNTHRRIAKYKHEYLEYFRREETSTAAIFWCIPG